MESGLPGGTSNIMTQAPSHEMRGKPTRWLLDYLDNLPIGIYRSTIEGKFAYCNRRMIEIFGFDAIEEIMAYPVVNIYWDKRDRGNFIQRIMDNGHADEVCLPFKTRQGEPIWCAVTARPVFDEDGIMIYLDGIIRDITEHVEGTETGVRLDETVNQINDLVMILDLDGTLLDINHAGADLLGARKADLLDRALSEFVVEKDRGLLPVFFSEVRKSGRKEAILAMVDTSGQEHFIEFHAFLVRTTGRKDHIRGIARDITDKVRQQSEELIRERFQGVLEMAGGVAHKMNQPLTVVNNLVQQTLREIPEDHPLYARMQRIQVQIHNLNDVATKIRRIHRYEAMDYVGGVKIVDLDKAS
jgi:PAS domain S-box-containing protein